MVIARVFDERVIAHRYKATSHAGIACARMVVGTFAYHDFGRGGFRPDLATIALVTAGIELPSLVRYRLRD
jgi:hypothetical protein